MTHDVTFTIPGRPLGKADVEFKVENGDGGVGTLKVLNGSVVWVPVNKTYGFKMTWKKFDAVMQ